MSSFTLDEIRAQADAKYASVFIEFGEHSVELLNPLRLSQEKRNRLAELQESMNELVESEDASDEQAAEQMADIIRTVAKGRKAADRLIDEIDGDVLLLMMVFENYSKGAQVGEASASHD